MKTDCETDGSSAALIIRVYRPPGAARLSPVRSAECGNWRHRPMESRHPALAPLLHTPTQHSLGWSLFLTIPSLYLHYIYTILLPSYVINMIHNMPFSSQTECRAVVTTTCRRYVLLTAIVVSYAQSVITSYPKLFGILSQ